MKTSARWSALVTVCLLLTRLPSASAKIPCDGNDVQSCSSKNQGLEFCCPKEWICLEDGCLDPSKPVCNTGGTCGQPCNSNFNCGDGLVCTYEPSIGSGVCSPRIIDEEPQDFTCSVARSPDSGPLHNIHCGLWLALVGIIVQRRRQSAA